MSKITSIFGNFESNEERETFMQAQFTTITNLTKQLEDSRQKIRHLEELLKEATPTIIEHVVDDISNEEKIAIEQLTLLKMESNERSLTLEETKRVDMYAKLLIQLRSLNKNKPMSALPKDPKELLKLVEEPSKFNG